jgi:hypothetical protein
MVAAAAVVVVVVVSYIAVGTLSLVRCSCCWYVAAGVLLWVC